MNIKQLAYFIADEIELRLHEGAVNPFDQCEQGYKEIQDFYLRLASKIKTINIK